ncbi:MAG: hypothetical protein DRJ03_15090 [Chloroflexi bacterium]|nr:MAG: hypothetical protein DRJ03_15090 [Chloroflexota bacterium]
MKLNLGCGPNKFESFINIDQSPTFSPDMQFDLEQPWPIDSNSVDFIYASHILEHIRNLIHVMRECHRTLKPQAKLEIYVPHYRHPIAYGDPSHVRFFSEESFFPFSIHSDRYQHLGIDFSFQLELNETMPDVHTGLPRQIHAILRKP